MRAWMLQHVVSMCGAEVERRATEAVHLPSTVAVHTAADTFTRHPASHHRLRTPLTVRSDHVLDGLVVSSAQHCPLSLAARRYCTLPHSLSPALLVTSLACLVMLSDALSNTPRATLPSPVNLQEFLQAAAARQAAERAEQEQRERQSVVWVAGLAGNAKRNSLGSVTTRRLTEKRSSATASPPATTSGNDDAIGSLLRHLKLQEEKPSPRPTTGSNRGSRNQPLASPAKRLVQHQSAPGSKRQSLLLNSDLAEHAASVSTPPVHPFVSAAGFVPPLMSPGGIGSPSRRRRSNPPRPPTAASASHSLPSVEHLRAIPFSRPSVLPLAPTVVSPLASPSHHSLTAVSTAASPLLAPLPAPPSPTTRRSSMPCQTGGPMQRFWADTRQSEFNGRRNSGSKFIVDDKKEGGSDTSQQQQQQEEVAEVQVKPIKQVRWRDDVEYEGRPRAGTSDAVVVKTAADPNYSWLPIGTTLHVEQ